ncbi:MAG: hypothetical protein KatS3mg076_0759 [Candidatus Binatia bacterium]|nr:MAG: hypothetical protein KatS3mg076_0759 [Candidatus Binatia bacterium]
MFREGAVPVLLCLLLLASPAPPTSGAARHGEGGVSGGLGLVEGEPVVVEAQEAELDPEARRLEYRGDVVLRQGNLVLRSDKLSVDFQGSLDGTDRFEIVRLRATGGVVLEQGGRKAEAREAEFRRRERVLVLRGEARLLEGPNRVDGDEVVVELDSGRSVVRGGKGRVRAVFVPPTDAARTTR